MEMGDKGRLDRGAESGGAGFLRVPESHSLKEQKPGQEKQDRQDRQDDVDGVLMLLGKPGNHFQQLLSPGVAHGLSFSNILLGQKCWRCKETESIPIGFAAKSFRDDFGRNLIIEQRFNPTVAHVTNTNRANPAS
jgi:hypothetical protein